MLNREKMRHQKTVKIYQIWMTDDNLDSGTSSNSIQFISHARNAF